MYEIFQVKKKQIFHSQLNEARFFLANFDEKKDLFIQCSTTTIHIMIQNGIIYPIRLIYKKFQNFHKRYKT